MNLLVPLVASTCCLLVFGKSSATPAASEAAELRPGVESTRLYGNLDRYAYYFIDLSVGSPEGQRVSVIVDTGSSLCGFPCVGCDHCGNHLDALFDLSKSKSAELVPCSDRCASTCQDNACAYTQGYAEGSTVSGVYFTDMVRLSASIRPNPPVRATLGCHLDERKLFYTQTVNGIMGLAPHSNHIQPTILQEFFGDNADVRTDLFSLCLSEWGGRLSVGGDHASFHPNASLQWAPMRLDTGYYVVDPVRLSLDGMSTAPLATATQDFGETILDSGTTYTYLPTQLFRKLDAAVGTAASAANFQPRGDGCWLVPNPDVGPSALPAVLLELLGGPVVRWEPNAYLFRRSSENGLWCRAYGDNGNTPGTVLGLSFMLHHDVVFDVSGSRFGVAPARCPEYRRAPGETSLPLGELVTDPLGTGAVEQDNTRRRILLIIGCSLLLCSAAMGVMSCMAPRSWCAEAEEDGEEDEGELGHAMDGSGRTRRSKQKHRYKAAANGDDARLMGESGSSRWVSPQ